MFKKALIVMVLAVMCAVFTAEAFAQEKNFESYVPDDALFYMSIDNLPATMKKLKDSPFGKMWDEPEFKTFVEKLMEFVQRNAEEGISENLGITFENMKEVSSLFSGQMAVVIDSVDWKKAVEKRMKYDFVDNELKYVEVEEEVENPILNVAFFCTVSDKAKIEEFIGKILAKAKEALATAESPSELTTQKETYKSAQYTVIKNSKEKDAAVYYGFVNNIFFFSLNEKAFKRFVDNCITPDAAGVLAKNADYKKVMADVGTKRDATMFFNCVASGRVLEKVIGVFAGKDPVGAEMLGQYKPKFMKAMELLGILDLKCIAGGIEVTPAGIVSTAEIYVPGVKRGLWKLATASKGPFQTLAVAPNDTTLFAAMHVSPAAVYDEIMKMCGELMEKEMFDMMTMQLDAFQKQMQMNLRKDLFVAMGPEIALSMDFKNFNLGGSEDLSEAMDFAMICALANQQSFEASLNKILSMVSPEAPETKAYGKFSTKIIASPAGDFCYCITNNMFVFGTDSGVKKVLDAITNPAKSVSGDPEYLNSSRVINITENSIYFSFFNTRKYFETFYSSMKSAGMGMMFSEDPAEKDLLDLFKFLPSKDVLVKYLSSTFDVAYSTESGILYRSFTPFVK